MALPNPLIQLDPDRMPEPPPHAIRKRRLIRRRGQDWSQALRRTVQVVFLLLNLDLGVQFFLFVRSFEGAQSLPTVTRPPGVEGWLPIADVKMLNFFRYLSTSAAITLLVLGLLSFFYQNFWCRYLCPYGALVGISSLASPAKIRRNADRCIDCAKCARACPALLPVDKLAAVSSIECTACYECVAICPAEGALQMSFPGRRTLPSWVLAAGVAIVFVGMVGWAKWANVWQSDIPPSVYQALVPIVQSFTHP